MPKYLCLYEANVEIYPTNNGCISIKSCDYMTDEPAQILLSVRQARMLLNDLPDLIQQAEYSLNDYILSGSVESDA